MGYIKKYPVGISFLVIFTILFFLIRFYNILNLPIFTDEAIYVRWAQIAKNDANWRFISLTDGKQPMFVWLAMISMRFIKDPLFAGRTVSVFAGFFTMIGLYFLGRELFKNKWVGILSSFLYLIFPFALVYDRMALYDSLVGTFVVWGFYLEVLLVRNIALDIALLASLVIGGGMLTKTNAFFNLYLLPLTLLLFDFSNKQKYKKLLIWIGLCAIVFVLSNIYYSILRLSPFFHIITVKNALFAYPFEEWIKHPFYFFWGNLWIGERDWLIKYLSLPMLLVAASSFFIERKYSREKIILFLWFLIPFLYLALFGNAIYPRFIFFMTLFLLPLIAFSLYKIFFYLNNKYLFGFVLIVVLFLPLKSDYFLLFDFFHAPIPISDLNQYNNDWPAGGGVKESIEFFKEQAKKGKIFIATQGTFGLMPASLEMYLLNNKNIELKGYWPISETIPKDLLEKSKKMPTYIVFHEPCLVCKDKMSAPSLWPLKVVLEYKKFAPQAYLTVYQVTPK